jgi:hypothetical protein
MTEKKKTKFARIDLHIGMSNNKKMFTFVLHIRHGRRMSSCGIGIEISKFKDPKLSNQIHAQLIERFAEYLDSGSFANTLWPRENGYVYSK